ncbi:MAG: HU family DNA-binding protein [Deltaproteobacteria bacterium]|jgi:integration host factor subunit alpha|nr:HU family DNA-binding protein [Deltaproteobacteria bacterium]
MTVTRDRIVSNIVDFTSLSPKEARHQVDLIIHIIKKALLRDKNMLVSGFGKFSVVRKRARRGHNPKTGKPMLFKAHNVVSFRLSRVLRKEFAYPIKKSSSRSRS